MTRRPARPGDAPSRDDTREDVKRRFGAAAEQYVHSQDHASGESLDRMIELLRPRPEWRALDVATGGGHTALALARHVHEVVATDLTAPMLAAAERYLREQGAANVTFREADAGTLPFPPETFDLVTCRIAAHHFPDCPAFLRESARVVQPGGLVVVIDNVVPEDVEAAAFINSFEKIRDSSHNEAYPESAWKRFYRDAGLSIVHAERFRKTRDFDRWLARMSVDAPTGTRLREMLLGATGAAREWLNPEEKEGALRFTLTELLILGRRGSGHDETAPTSNPSSV